MDPLVRHYRSYPLWPVCGDCYWVWVLVPPGSKRLQPFTTFAQSIVSHKGESHHWDKLTLFFLEYHSEVASKLRTSSWNIYSCGDGSLGENKPAPENIFKVWDGRHAEYCTINYKIKKKYFFFWAMWMKGFTDIINLGPVNVGFVHQSFFTSSPARTVSSNFHPPLWVILGAHFNFYFSK